MVEFCKKRECLSREDRLRRSYYEVLRDELDQFVMGYSLVGSYNNFLRMKIPYPFVELRELKPRARIPSTEFEAQNSFLIIFCEDVIDDKHKKYIRYFDANKTTKTNLLHHKYFRMWRISTATSSILKPISFLPCSGLCCRWTMPF